MENTAKIFESGNSQAIRLPKVYRFAPDVKELIVRQYGYSLVLTPKDKAWENFVENTKGVSDDFLSEDLRDRQEPEEREPLW